LYREVVEELLSEVAAEALTSAAAADVFGMDMLVAAVAFSTGKYVLGLREVDLSSVSQWQLMYFQWSSKRLLHSPSTESRSDA
jgi:hypothetical protein